MCKGVKQNRPLSTNLEVALSNSDIDKTITVYDIKTYGIIILMHH